MKRSATRLLWVALLPLSLHAADVSPNSTPVDDRKLEQKFEGIFSKFLRRDVKIGDVRWRVFPVRFTATNITLWEEPKVLMAEGAMATLTVSMKTLTSGRIRVKDMWFPNAKAYLRFDHNGKTNVTSMIKDLGAYARKNYKRGQKQKVAYGAFRIENASLEVIDRELGVHPFGAAFRLNGRGDISGLGPQTKFPFRLNAVLLSSATPMNVDVIGTVSARPQFHIAAQKIPLSVAIPYLPVVRWFDGEMKADLDFSTAGAYTFWKLRVIADAAKANIPLPFPLVQVDGLFHAFAPSHLNVTLSGKPTKINVRIDVKNFKSKNVALTVTSKGADINECIQWCRTGYWLNEAPATTMNLPPASRWPVVWKITGAADIDAKLVSVMGPRLIHDVDGVINIHIENGRLAGMPGLIKAFALLNLSSMLGDPNKPPTGLQFGSVVGDITVKNGVARTNQPIVIESPSINLGVVGQVDFVHQQIDAKMLIGVASVSDAVIAHIPLVRRFKSGDKKGVIPIWLSIQGPLNDPQVKLLPLKTFDRNLWKMLPAPFQIPEKVLKSIYEKEK